MNATDFLIIFFLYAFNFYLSRKVDDRGKYFLHSSLILTGLIIFVYIIYYSAVNLGFPDGLMYGMVNNQIYQDNHNYFYESLTLRDIFINPDFALWRTGDYPMYGFYGPYNSFNIFNALLLFIVKESPIQLILVKLIFSLAAIYYLYIINRDHFKLSTKYLPIYLFAASPSFIMSSAALLRDNIICLVIIYSFYHYLSFLRGQNSKPHLIRLVIGFIIGFLIRPYTVFFHIGFVIHFLIKRKIKLQTLFLIGAFASIFVLIVVYAYINIAGFKTILTSIIEYDNSNAWFSQNTQGINAVMYASYYTIINFLRPLSLGFSPVFLERMTEFDYYYLNIILFLNFISIVLLWRKKYADKAFLFIFSFALPFFFNLSYTVAFGAVVPRVFLQWIWLFPFNIIKQYESNPSASKLAYAAALIFTFLLIIGK